MIMEAKSATYAAFCIGFLLPSCIVEVKQLDLIDVRLLALLQENGRTTVSELSKAVNLSRTSIAERLSRLEERNVITGFTARVSPSGVGRDVLVIIGISQLNVSCRKFEDFIANDPDIIECHRVTGAISYIMKAGRTLDGRTGDSRGPLDPLRQGQHLRGALVSRRGQAHLPAG